MICLALSRRIWIRTLVSHHGRSRLGDDLVPGKLSLREKAVRRVEIAYAASRILDAILQFEFSDFAFAENMRKLSLRHLNLRTEIRKQS